MSIPSTSPDESPASNKANRIPAAVGFLADVAGIVAFLLAGVKVIALVLGAVAIVFGCYLIAARWGKPLRVAALAAIAILVIGSGLVGGVVGHMITSPTSPPSPVGDGPSTSPHLAKSAGSGSEATESPSPSAVPAGVGQTQSPSVGASPDINSTSTPVNLGDPRQGLMTNANGFGAAIQITINAKSFAYGLSGCKIQCGTATSDFNLGRAFSTLTARLGVLDSSRAGASAHIQVVADGNVVASKTVQLGVSYDISVSVKNVLRLQFVESNDGGVVPAVGDPIVTP